MKLLNRSIYYLSAAFLLIIGIWAVIFYFNLKDEIRDSIDDGIDNNRLLIIQKIYTDSTLLQQKKFGGNNFKVRKILKQTALKHRDVFKDTLMYRLNENDLEPVRVLHTAFEFKEQYYKLTVISSLVEEDDLIEDSFWSVVWLFILLVACIILINNVILHKVWNPFYDILNKLQHYKLDKDKNLITVNTNIKEFKQLQDAANTLIQRSKDTYNSQKQFTENAAHELQTPIAIITNKLELLLESETLTKPNAQSISDVMQIVDRLKRLNKSLLLLAKLENNQFKTSKIISINALTQELITDLEEFIAFKNITLVTNNKDQLDTQLDKSLATMLITNLLKNAIIHNVKGGQITINITQEAFSIHNTGYDIGLNKEAIFNRFHKSTTKSQSTGLGLAICKAICDSHKLPIDYQFINNEHIFSIYFKKNI